MLMLNIHVSLLLHQITVAATMAVAEITPATTLVVEIIPTTCGNNLTDLMVYIDPSAYVNSGDPVYAYYDINCTIPNTNYT